MIKAKKKPSQPQHERRLVAWPATVAIVAVLALGGVAARVIAAQDAFWLDEIWSLVYYARTAPSAWHILAHIPDSNNHHLVTLWMYLCGDVHNWFIYRLPSLVAGIGTIVLAAYAARRLWGWSEALVAVVLTSSSFVLVTYSSEARGYAPAGFFALAAFLLLDRWLARPRWWLAASFGLAVLLGFMSHLTFVFFYAGAVAWSAVVIKKPQPDWGAALVAMLKCHLPALAGCGAFYLVALREYVVGRAPDHVLFEVLGRTLAVAIGGATIDPWLFASLAAVTVALIAAGLYGLWRDGSDLWVFFATTIVFAPAALLLTSPSAVIERFFYIGIVFFLLQMSYLGVRAWRWNALTSALAAATLALYLVGNGYYTFEFLRFGRGSYLEALEYIVSNSPGAQIDLTSDNEFRTTTIVNFYAPYLSTPAKFVHHEPTSREPIEWLILHDNRPNARPYPVFTMPDKTQFAFKRLFPYSGLSGFHWAVYRRK